MSGLLPASLRLVTGKLKDLASDIVTVRTGTVVSDFAPMSQTLVTLDNDPESAQVQAQALGGPLPAGARVQMIAFPPRGLVILGVMIGVSGYGSTIQVFTANGSFADPGSEYATLIIETWAGGGGGGSAAASTAGNCSMGGGGGGGGYARAVVATSGLTFPLQVNHGAGGTADVAGSNASVVDNNGAGAVLCRALGGGAGAALANGATLWQNATGGAGGSADVGDLLAVGGPGLRKSRATITAAVHGGEGGQGAMGGGGAGATVTTGGSGNPPGGGGGGAFATNGAGANSGGSGGAGRIAITALPHGVQYLG